MSTKSNGYEYWVKFAARTSVTVAVLLLIMKIFAWFDSEASVMLATATDSLLDLFASLMNLFILKIALSPPDQDHRFGHGKAESLGSLFQAAFITGSAILLMLNGADRLINPVKLTQTSLAINVTIATVVLTLLLVLFQQYVVKRTGSLAISADMLHYKSDLLLNVAVLVALVLSQKLWPLADGLFTLIIGGYLLISAISIAKQSFTQLMDQELDEEDIRKIKDIVFAHPQAIGIHDLKTRQSGPMTFIQFHLELDGELTLLVAHNIGESIEQEIAALYTSCEVLIHHDPSSVVKNRTLELE
ncbi:cation diffusion facilitator family transporter [Thalassotalea atypica]|uniref:cation diffusion facilitator family transporter n=1 Tax=Thalassotalea atypica TaxID=2054316 RepID=UPI0025725E46|nr:cation diffusion facilitator family transporter [Thalassotalea atypica]